MRPVTALLWAAVVMAPFPASAQQAAAEIRGRVLDSREGLLPQTGLVLRNHIAQAPAQTGRDFAHLVELARADGWPGYFGAPAYATAAIGAANQEDRARRLIATALKVLDGWDPAAEPRFGDMMLKVDAAVRGVIERSRRHDDEIEARQRAWLASKGLQ
jgi:hypothetical protein